MPGKIRVHELAKELGLTNQETLDLCFALSIGVKSHSSSIVEAQADRVRRRAERDGLLKPPPPPPPPPPVEVAEPEPEAKEPVEAKPPDAKKPVATRAEAKEPVAAKAEAERSARKPAAPAKPAVEIAAGSRPRPAAAAEVAASHQGQPVEPAAAVKTPATEPARSRPSRR